LKVAFYLRVSTTKQDTDNQFIRLQREAAARKHEVVRIYQEHESAFAKNAKQSQLEAAKLAAQAGEYDILMVAALDRLTRRGPLAALQLVKLFNSYNVKVISLAEPFITDNSMSDVFIAITAWAGEWESKIKQERVFAGLERARKAGKTLGRKPGRKDSPDVKRERSGYIRRWELYRKEKALNNHTEISPVLAGDFTSKKTRVSNETRE